MSGWILAGAAIGIMFLLMWGVVAGPKSEAEQKAEDDAQEDWCGRYRGHAEDKR